jgi:hypothetical protein
VVNFPEQARTEGSTGYGPGPGQGIGVYSELLQEAPGTGAPGDGQRSDRAVGSSGAGGTATAWGRKPYHIPGPELEDAGVKIGRDGFFEVLRERSRLLDRLAGTPKTTNSRHSLPVFHNSGIFIHSFCIFIRRNGTAAK